MTINVQGPDGSNLAFPDGTPHDEIVSAMDSHYGGGQKAPTEGVTADNFVRSLSHGLPVVGGAMDKIAATMDAATQPVLGRGSPAGSYAERKAANLATEQAKTAGFEEAHPYVDTAAKVGGGILGTAPLVAAAPAAMGVTGTLPQMVGRGAVSGAALGAADEATRGGDIGEGAGVGAITGAAAGPIGRVIGKAVQAVRPKPPLVPQNTVRAGGVDIMVPPADAAGAHELEMARKGAQGDPAQRIAAEADQQVSSQIGEATRRIGASFDEAGGARPGELPTPAQAAERISSELGTAEQTRFQTEQDRLARARMEGETVRGGLAPDAYTGQPTHAADTPLSAAEQVGAGVGREADAARAGVGRRYTEANAVPGVYDPEIPRTMAEEIRARAARGEDRLQIDRQTAGVSSQALKLIDESIGPGGLFHNEAAPAPGGAGPGGAAAPPSDAQAAFSKLTADGIAPERARSMVANLPGSEALPQHPMQPHSVSTAAGGSVDVAPRVVEASSVKTSADPGYNQDLQPRNRMRAASDVQINDMAKNITPNRLGVSAEADRGAPIMGPDSMVESGNGRVLALRQMYKENGPQALRYRAWLASEGVKIDGMKEPILVRERTTPMTHDQRKAFTVAANQSSTLSLSGPERALADSRALSPETLGMIRNPGDLGAVENRDFVRQFMQSVPASERGALMTANGDLSAEGLSRMRNAVMAKAYGNSSILARAAESTRDEIRSISAGLQTAAPEWAQMRAAAHAGDIPKSLDATPHLLDAVERTAKIRGKGTTLAEGLAQGDAFRTQSPESEAFMRLFYDADGKRAASASSVGNALRNYAQEASKVDASPGLGLGMPEITSRDILAATSRKVGAPTQLAEEVATAAKEAAAPPSAAAPNAPISDIGVREMDAARKRLNSLRGDVIRAVRMGNGSESDLHAINRIIHEFDNVIRDAHAAGRFSGDSAAVEELMGEAHAAHSEYKRTFSKAAGADKAGAAVEKILGRHGVDAATPEEIARLSYGPVGEPGGTDATRVGQRLRQILGPSSHEWGAYKQGLLDYVKGNGSPREQGERILNYLHGEGQGGRRTVKTHPGMLLSAQERAAMETHADNLIASEPMKIGELKGVDKKIAKITGRLDGVPSSPQDIVKHLFGGPQGTGSTGERIALIQHLRRVMTPEGFTMVKQASLAHLLQRPEGIADWGYAAQAKHLNEYLAGNISKTLHTPKELGDLRDLANALQAQVPPAGVVNTSNTAPFLTKVAKGMSSWILPVIGFSHGGFIGAGLGHGAGVAMGKIGNARAAQNIRSLYYGKQPTLPIDPRYAKVGAIIGGSIGRSQIGNR